MIHNQILIGQLAVVGLELGASVQKEVHVRLAQRSGFIDMVLSYEHATIAVEAELSPRRARLDVEKAQAAGANALIIVTPNRRIAEQTRRRALSGRDETNFTLGAWFLTLGQAKNKLKSLFAQISHDK